MRPRRQAVYLPVLSAQIMKPRRQAIYPPVLSCAVSAHHADKKTIRQAVYPPVLSCVVSAHHEAKKTSSFIESHSLQDSNHKHVNLADEHRSHSRHGCRHLHCAQGLKRAPRTEERATHTETDEHHSKRVTLRSFAKQSEQRISRYMIIR